MYLTTYMHSATPFFIRPWVDVVRLIFRELRVIKMWSKEQANPSGK